MSGPEIEYCGRVPCQSIDVGYEVGGGGIWLHSYIRM